MQFVATCAFGLEKLVFNEIKKLGLWVIKTEDGRVTFEGKIIDMIRANLWLRTAGRVHIKMDEFVATDFDTLFDRISDLPWEDFIGEHDAFPVAASSAKSILHSEPAIQSIVKKAIVKRLGQKYNRSILPEDSEVAYQIRVHVNKDNFLITIDTSGESLHKRGYRSQANLAPIKESLAAALVTLTGWTPEKKLIDPFCGSGTLVIEAALIAMNIAPGLRREFAFQKWPWVSPEDTAKAYKEAREAAIDMPDLNIHGYDISRETLAIAKANAERAGVDEFIHFECNDFNNLLYSKFKDATFIANPPYGERLNEKHEVELLYRQFGRKFLETKNCSLFLITPDSNFPTLFGRRPDKNRKLFNGPIQCYLYSFLPKQLT